MCMLVVGSVTTGGALSQPAAIAVSIAMKKSLWPSNFMIDLFFVLP